MALDTRIALAALLIGTSAPAGMLWAQTTDAPAADAATTDGAAEAPATDAAATTDSPAPADATSEPATDAAAAPATPEAPAAPAAAAEPQIGAFYVDSTHGDWTLRCQRTPDGKDPCELYQLMRDGEGNAVAEISMIPLEGKAAAGATLVAPLETDLVPGIGFKVDAGKQQAYPFSFCAPVGCVSRVGFTQAELDALKRGKQVTVSLLPYGVGPDERVELGLSLGGFTAAWDALKAKPSIAEAAADVRPPAAQRAPAAAAEAPAAGEAPAADAAPAEAPAADAPAAESTEAAPAN